MMNPLLLSPYRNRKQSFPTVPSFLPAQVRFYDPLTGQEGPSLNSGDEMYVTSKFNECGIIVDIAGKKKDVEKAIALIRVNHNAGSVVPSSGTSTTPTPSVVGTTGTVGTIMTPLGPLIVPSTSVSSVSGWSYIVNPKNPSKVLLTGPGLTKPFSGSGVIFFEKILTPDGRSTGNVILAKTRRGMFEDFGGQLDTRVVLNEHTLKSNARKEAFEESQCLFAIENTDLERKLNGLDTFIDVADIENDALYRCYLICVNVGSSNLEDIFLRNKGTVSAVFPRRSDYDETIELGRFRLGSIKNCTSSGTSGNVNCVDSKGNTQTIRDRTANCLRAVISNTKLLNELFAASVSVTSKRVNNLMSECHGRESLYL